MTYDSQNGLKPSVSNALFSQVNLLDSFAALFNESIPKDEARDSENHLDALLGESDKATSLVEGNTKNALAIVKGDWKYNSFK